MNPSHFCDQYFMDNFDLNDAKSFKKSAVQKLPYFCGVVGISFYSVDTQ